MLELIKSTAKNLFKKRLRTLLTVAGIGVGTLLITLVSVLGDTGKAIIGKELSGMGLDGIAVSADADVLNEDALMRIRALYRVDSAMPLAVQVTTAKIGVLDAYVAACGIDAGADQVISLEILHGRLLERGDISGSGRVCVVDEAVAENAYGRKNIVGKTLALRVGDATETFTVVGVSKAGSSVMQNVAGYIPYMVYFPYTALREITGDETFDRIAVRIADATDMETARASLQRMLAGADTEDATYTLDNLATQRDKLERLMDIIALVLKIISAVSLLVAGMSIMTVMLVSVHERTGEIGIKKAVGATGGRIMLEFMAEAVLLTLAGSVVGVLTALLSVWVAALVSGIAVTLSLSTIFGIVLFSVFLGVVFGVYPAQKAAALPPAVALRSI